MLPVVQAIAHLHDQPLGGLLADARQPHQGSGIAVLHAADELIGGDPGEDGQRQPGADPADLDQRPKQAALVLAGEAEQQVGILADHQMGVQGHRLTHRRQGVEGGHGGFQFVAHTGHVQQQGGRLFGKQGARESTDHAAASLF